MTTKLQSQITDNVRKTINENLPAAVAEELKQYLTEAEQAFKELKETKKLSEVLAEEVAELRNLTHKAENLEKDKKILDSEFEKLRHERREFEFKQEILKLKEKHAEERLGELRSLTERVFASNKIGYNLGLSIPNFANPNNLYNSTMYASGTLTQTEG